MRIIALFLLAAFLASMPIAHTYQECANTGLDCGITLHTYWMRWDRAEDGYVPMFAQCSVCGYSWYLDHARVK